VVLVQVKTRDWPGTEEMETLRLFTCPGNCRKLVHRRRDRQRLSDVREVVRGFSRKMPFVAPGKACTATIGRRVGQRGIKQCLMTDSEQTVISRDVLRRGTLSACPTVFSPVSALIPVAGLKTSRSPKPIKNRMSEKLPAALRKVKIGRTTVILPESTTYGDWVALGVCIEAGLGNPAAAREIADRLEGKVVKPIEVSGPEGGPLDVQLPTDEHLTPASGNSWWPNGRRRLRMNPNLKLRCPWKREDCQTSSGENGGGTDSG